VLFAINGTLAPVPCINCVIADHHSGVSSTIYPLISAQVSVDAVHDNINGNVVIISPELGDSNVT
jgi:hypothetical protein